MADRFYAGFSTVSLKPAITLDKNFVDEVNVNSMALGNGTDTCVIVVIDIVSMRAHLTFPLRAEIAKTLDMGEDQICIYTTHNHGSRTSEMDMEKFNRACVASAGEAVGSLKEVEVARIAVHPSVPINIRRRIHFKDYGAFSFWYGHRDLGNGTADGSHLIKLELNNLFQGNLSYVRCLPLPEEPGEDDFNVPDAPVPVEEPLLFPEATDDLVQGLFFREPDGTPAGSCIRFSAHAVTANRTDTDWRSGDYPVYMMRKLREKFGGNALYLPGPAGNQCPVTERKSLSLAKKFGEQLADIALEPLGNAEWEQEGPFGFCSPNVCLPPRKEIFMTQEEIDKEISQIKNKIKDLAGNKDALAELKVLNERHELLKHRGSSHPEHWKGISDEELKTTGYCHPLFAVRMGTTVMAGLPGEPFAEYSVRLRQETGLGDRLIVTELANGHISYFPTKEEYAAGSYEPVSCSYIPESEDLIISAAEKGISELESV